MMSLVGLLFAATSCRITMKLGSSGKIMTRRTKERERVHGRLLDGLHFLFLSWPSPTQRCIGETCIASNHKVDTDDSMEALAIAAFNHRIFDINSWFLDSKM